MRRSAPLLLACLLLLTTGLALLGAASLVSVPASTAAPPAAERDADEASTALVRRFYEAVNATLRTGDPTPVAALVAPDFADRTAHPGLAPTRDGLVQYVLTLRAAFPSLRLEVEDLLAQGDWVLARVTGAGTAHGVFLGVPLSGMPASWGGLDVIRVADGRIAERWAAAWPVLPQPLAQAPLAEPPSRALVRLARFTYSPGAHQPQTSNFGPLLVAVEVGTLTARVEGEAVLVPAATAGTSGPSQPTASPGAEIELRPGDGLLVSPGIRHTLRNAEETPAVVLALTLLPWSAGAPDGTAFRWPEAGSPDVTAQLLADGVVAVLPVGPAVLTLGRLTLAAGAGLAPAGACWPRLAVVEAGTLGLATADGPTTHLAAGQGALVPAAAGTTLRNAGDSPLVVLLVAITPAAPATGPETPDRWMPNDRSQTPACDPFGAEAPRCDRTADAR